MKLLPSTLAALVLGVTAMAAGCHSSAASSPSSTGSGGVVAIKGFRFEPATVKAKVGRPVAVANADDSPHTLTADDKSFDTGDIVAHGTATFTPAKAGTVSYHCDIHDYMRGGIDVSP